MKHMFLITRRKLLDTIALAPKVCRRISRTIILQVGHSVVGKSLLDQNRYFLQHQVVSFTSCFSFEQDLLKSLLDFELG